MSERYIVTEYEKEYFVHDTFWNFMTTTYDGYSTKYAADYNAERLNNDWLFGVEGLYNTTAAIMARHGINTTTQDDTETEALRQRVQELEAENETLHSQIQRALELLAGYHESLIGSTLPTAIDFQSLNHASEEEQE